MTTRVGPPRLLFLEEVEEVFRLLSAGGANTVRIEGLGLSGTITDVADLHTAQIEGRVKLLKLVAQHPDSKPWDRQPIIAVDFDKLSVRVENRHDWASQGIAEQILGVLRGARRKTSSLLYAPQVVVPIAVAVMLVGVLGANGKLNNHPNSSTRVTLYIVAVAGLLHALNSLLWRRVARSFTYLEPRKRYPGFIVRNRDDFMVNGLVSLASLVAGIVIGKLI